MLHYKNFSIAAKLNAMLYSGLAGFFIFTGFVYNSTIYNTNVLKDIKHIYMPVLEHTQANKERLESLSGLILTAINTHEVDLLDETSLISEKIRISLQAIGISKQISTMQLTEIQNTFDIYYENAIFISKNLIKNNVSVELSTDGLKSIGEKYRSLQTIFDSVHTQSNQRFNNAILAANRYANRIIYMCIIAMILFSLIGFLTASSLRKNIFIPIKSLIKSTDIIAGGDINHQASINSEDELGRLASSFNDMTRTLRENYAELSDKNTELILAAKSKNSFLANTSHEIRTPLTAIIGFSEELLNESLKGEDAKYALNCIISSGVHLKNVINDILDLSKIEADKLNVEKTDTDLQQLVYDVEAIIKMRAIEKNLAFNIDYDFPLPKSIQTDPLRLKQILINLAGNATKFTEQGRISIKVHLDKTSELLHFSVFDSGIGIAAADIEKIFKMFSQADDSTTRLYGGTGLGLPLSRKLVSMLGGEMWVNSRVGIGSEFGFSINIGETTELELSSWPQSASHLQLPKKQVTESNKANPVLLESKKPTGLKKQVAESFNNLFGNVLLAEDTDTNQKLIAFFLRNTNINLSIVNNGKEAVDAALSNQYDLILMDIQMPVMSGIEAITILKENEVQVPVVAVTANVLAHDMVNYVSLGFSATIPKPLEKNYFLESISLYLPTSNSSTNDIELTMFSQENKMPVTFEKTANSHQNLQKFSTLLAGLHDVYDQLSEMSIGHHSVEIEDSIGPIYSDNTNTDPEFLALLDTFVKSLSKTKNSVLDHTKNKQWEALSFEIHNIKGSAGAFGYRQLTSLATAIHQHLIAKTYNGVESEIKKFIDVCEQIIAGYNEQADECSKKSA